MDDASDDGIEVGENILLGDAKDAPAEIVKFPVPSRVRELSVLVVPAIDLDDEANLRASEVDDDEGGDDELPPEGEPGLGTSKTTPKAFFRARG